MFHKVSPVKMLSVLTDFKCGMGLVIKVEKNDWCNVEGLKFEESQLPHFLVYLSVMLHSDVIYRP